MRKSLPCAVLVAEALGGCWRAAPPEPAPAPIAATIDRARCQETGERLHLRVCRDDNDDLAWTVTNRTTETLWVFVAPPSFGSQQPSRANAFVEADRGAVQLHKIQIAGAMAEPIMTGAVALAPGASDGGVVPLGGELVPEADNLFPRSGARQWPARQRIRSATLEVGFATRAQDDHPIAPDAHRAFYLFMSFDRGREELVRSPELAWP